MLKTQELIVHKIIENNPITQERLKKRSGSDRPICPNPKNKWTHEMDCLEREVEE